MTIYHHKLLVPPCVVIHYMAPLAKERMEASVVGEIATVAVSLDMIYDNIYNNTIIMISI